MKHINIHKEIKSLECLINSVNPIKYVISSAALYKFSPIQAGLLSTSAYLPGNLTAKKLRKQ